MLNITDNSVSDSIQLENFKSYSLLKRSRIKRLTLFIVICLSIIFIIGLFLPWTQNINAKGYVTTRSPEQRPQAIQSIIGGRIEKWFVREGDFVAKGDTIVFFSEVKSEYFDPDLIIRTEEQVAAKLQSVDSYDQKVAALKRQYNALEDGLRLKRAQIKNKMIQAQNKIEMDSIDLVAFKNNYQIAKNQLDRIEVLHKKGLKSLSELQDKELKIQSTEAKVKVQENKLLNQKNEIINLKLELLAAERNNAEKLAKIQSDQQSAISSKLESVAATSKLKNKLSNYNERQKLYFVIAPQSGYITKILKKGIGEYIKEGTDIATVMPDKYDLTAEVYIKPQDLPLISIGNNVRLRFDGWPAVAISGWPKSSIGIFSGNIIAIDRFVSENGNYRLLISPKEIDKQWPKELRVGIGVQAFILLNDVPLWYEIWRQLNGFPAKFYEQGKKNEVDVKRKAPIKSIK